MPTAVLPENVREKDKYLGLDHLRALAITLVILFHFQSFGHPQWLNNQFTSFGWSGVDLFFVLSGFLIAGQLFGTIARGKRISLKEFFAKRFFRIIPPYLVMLVLYTAFPLLREREQFAPLWRYLTFTLNFGLNISKYGTFTHAWSLCIEEQFYLLLPLIVMLFSYLKIGKQSVWLLAGLFIAGFAIRLFIYNYYVVPQLSSGDFSVWYKYIYYPTYTRLDGLITGVCIAGLYTFYPNIRNKIASHGNLILLAGLALLVAAFFVCEDHSGFKATVFGFPLVSLAYGLMVAGVVLPSCFIYRLKSWLTAQLATLSYSIYLIHKLMVHLTQSLLEKAGLDKNSNLVFILSIVSAIAGALLLRYLIEKPSLKLRNRALAGWRKKRDYLSAVPSQV